MSAVPYADVLTGRDPEPVIRETAARVLAAYARLSPEQIETAPAPGKWSPREVMAHLADCEIAWGWRLRQALAEDRAEMQPFDQDGWAKPYPHYSHEDAKATYIALRAWNVAFVSALTEADKRRPIVHPERGEETLWTLVEIMAGHDLHHLKILEVS